MLEGQSTETPNQLVTIPETCAQHKEGVLAPANEGYEVLTPANIIHAPYVLEFVEIPQQKRYKETELEKALKINMEQFLSELGRCLYWRTNWCQTFQS